MEDGWNHIRVCTGITITNHLYTILFIGIPTLFKIILNFYNFILLAGYRKIYGQSITFKTNAY